MLSQKNRLLKVVLMSGLLTNGVAWAQDDAAEEAANDPAKEAQKAAAELLPLEDLQTFTNVFGQIRAKYVDEIDDRTLLRNAIKGMLEGLDPHSTYLDRDSFSELQEHTSGEFGGLGMEVGMENGFVKVIFDAKYGEWLGCHMIGAGVTDMIAEAVLGRKLETTGHEVLKAVHPHPTMSEAVMEAVADAYDEVIHL